MHARIRRMHAPVGTPAGAGAVSCASGVCSMPMRVAFTGIRVADSHDRQPQGHGACCTARAPTCTRACAPVRGGDGRRRCQADMHARAQGTWSRLIPYAGSHMHLGTCNRSQGRPPAACARLTCTPGRRVRGAVRHHAAGADRARNAAVHRRAEVRCPREGMRRLFALADGDAWG
jgi:hypothetical protein